MIRKICVAGAGTMGSGIALSAALHGFDVILFDTNDIVIGKARDSIAFNLRFLLEKKKITQEDLTIVSSRISFTSTIENCISDLVIEAIIEKMEAKTELFRQLALINSRNCIFASNTSSLSITALQLKIETPERVAGLHFFNPAHIMKLVEVVKGAHTSEAVVQELTDLSEKMGKTAVLCSDSPGFIVNRVARHYYLEAMKLVENGTATIENVDEIMEATGFKMGPFKLMDLIGMDINLAVSESLYEALDHAERLRPSAIQKEKVRNGELGRKTGKGFYQY